jgi:CHAT domain-containing protein/tetratricopeptide (TPR) repeat protein
MSFLKHLFHRKSRRPFIPIPLRQDLNRAQGAAQRYLNTSDRFALDEAAAAWERILNHPAFDIAAEQFQLAARNNAGGVFLQCYWVHGRLGDLDRALSLWQEAVSLAPADSPERPAFLTNLGIGLRDRFLRTGHMRDLEESIRVCRQAVSLTSANSPELPSRLNNLGIGLRDRYARNRQVEDLEESIQVCRQAVTLTPAGSPGRAARLTNLGIGLRDRYARSGQLEDLEEAIRAYRQAVSLTPVGSPERPSLLNNLGAGLSDRYARSRQLEDLEESIRVHRQAITLTPTDSPERAARLDNLGTGLRDRYTHSGQLEDLEEAIRLHCRAVSLTPTDSLSRPSFLNNLGIGLHERYAHNGRLEDLGEAIQAYRQAISLTPTDLAEKATRLNNLGNGLSDRYAHSGRMQDLEEAIHIYRQAASLDPADPAERASILNNLGLGLYERYGRTGRSEDLEKAIWAVRQAMALTPDDSSERPTRLSSLGVGLRERYAHTGQLEDLEEAIRAHRRAVSLAPADSPQRPSLLNNLGIALHDRYARNGQLGDLEEAIRVHRQAVSLTPATSPSRPGRLNSLGIVLRDCYVRGEQLEDLEEAVRVCRQAVSLTPADSPDQPGRLNNLGNCLRARYAHSGQLEDLEEAIQIYGQAVTLTPIGSPARPGHLNNLGTGLSDRYARSRRLEDLEEAIQTYRQAVLLIPADSPARPIYLNNLGNGLHERHTRTGQPEDLNEAIHAYKEACQRGMATALEESLRAAWNWGHCASERQAWDEATQAYGYGQEASERLFQGQLLRTNKEAWLRATRDLYARAAYAQARTGDLSRAVETLEQGHARLLSQTLQRDRANLLQLETRAPKAYEWYVAAAEQLRILESRELGSSSSLSPGQTLADAMRQAWADLDGAVETIRQVPGYEGFLKPLPFAQIQDAIEPGRPAVYLAVAPAGTLELIVPPSQTSEVSETSQVRPLWCDLTADALRKRIVGADNAPESGVPELGGYIGAYARRRERSPDTDARDAWFIELDETAHWLWDALMGQLVDALSALGFDQAILIPQGWLGLLPLHAAWTEVQVQSTCEMPGTSRRRYAMDDVCFSYAPNARALRAARQTANRVASDRLLVVDNPDGSLHFSVAEVGAALAAYDGEKRSYLSGQAASKRAVREALAGYSVWHLSTHGAAGWSEPLDGRLRMADGVLTLREILALRVKARLALLSACEMGVPGIELPDEVVSLPTGLIQAGVAGTVAPLWAVNELSTALLFSHFYDAWRQEGQDPAQALCTAQRWLRDATRDDLDRYYDHSLDSAKRGWANALQGLISRLGAARDERPFAHPFYWAAFTMTGV